MTSPPHPLLRKLAARVRGVEPLPLAPPVCPQQEYVTIAYQVNLGNHPITKLNPKFLIVG